MLPHSSLGAAVRFHSTARPGAPAIFGTGRGVCSYLQLTRHLERAGAALEHRLPAHNRTIAVAAANGPDLLTAIVLAMSHGICAPLDASRPPDETEAFLTEIVPAVVLADEGAIARHGAAFRRHGIAVLRIDVADEAPAGVFDLVDEAPRDATFGDRVPAEDIVLLVRTSGSTGRSKIIGHTMPRLMHIFASIVDVLDLRPSDRCLNARPLHHVHAIAHIIGASLVAGASVVCPTDTGAAALIGGLRTYRPTWYSASPPVHRDVLATVRAQATRLEHTLRFVRSSSAALDPQLERDLEFAFGAPVLQGYGMSEAPVITLNPAPPRIHKPGSVGRPAAGEVAILNGEVVVRGQNVAPTFARGEQLPIVDPETGWFHTGDAGIIDDDGYLFLTGRLNELINVGGEKIAPFNVERALLAHAAISDAVCFPLPHPTLGQHVAAAVVTHDGETVTQAQLIEHAAQLLPRPAVPNIVHVVPAIARDGNGKIRRRDLAIQFARDPSAALAGPSRATDDSLLHALSRIWEDVLEYAPVAIDENFFAAGGDSLRAMRVMMSIEKVLGVTMPLDTLLYAPTVTALARAVLALANDANPSRIIALRPAGSRPPLFFFDGDINGGGLYTRFLPAVLNPDQPIYIVRPNGALGDAVPASIEAMADHDAAMIASAVPAKAYRLAGYCNGGVIAFEAARRLEAAGCTVDVVALIGSSAPNALLEPVWAITSLAARFTQHRDHVRVFSSARTLANALRAQPARDRFGHLVKSARYRIQRGLGIAPAQIAAPAEPSRSTASFLLYADRLIRYFPMRSELSVDLIWGHDDVPRIMGDDTMGWRHVASVRRWSMPGDHTTILTDHVGELGAAIRSIFDAADRAIVPAVTVN